MHLLWAVSVSVVHSREDSRSTHRVVHVPLPTVDQPRHLAVSREVVCLFATPCLPSSVLRPVSVVALHAGQHVVRVTLEVQWLVEPVEIPCPIALVPTLIGDIDVVTVPLPHPVPSISAICAPHSVEPLTTAALCIQPTIVSVLPLLQRVLGEQYEKKGNTYYDDREMHCRKERNEAEGEQPLRQITSNSTIFKASGSIYRKMNAIKAAGTELHKSPRPTPGCTAGPAIN